MTCVQLLLIMTSKFLALFISLCAMAAGVHAGSIVSYKLDGSAAPTTTATNVTASRFEWVTPWEGAQINATYFTVPTGQTGEFDRYVSFTVTAAEGHRLNLDTLTFDFGGGRADGTGYEGRAKVRSSLDNFKNDLTISRPPGDSLSTTATAGGPGSTLLSFSVDVSGVANASSVTFRFYLADNMNVSNYYTRLDNIVLNGAVVSTIPEPSTYSMLMGGTEGSLVPGAHRTPR